MATLAPSLVIARATIDQRWPGRDRASDGWIGDAAHQGRTSDHNPNSRGRVDAIDVDMFGGATPVHRQSVIAGFIRGGRRVNYVIHNRRIYQESDQFRPRAYDGINPHTEHLHCSIDQTITAELDTSAWPILGAFPIWPLLRRGYVGPAAADLQAYLNAWGASLAVDSDFGPATDGAVRSFQRACAITVDGIVGPVTRGRLFG